jgi:hypothetical protein
MLNELGRDDERRAIGDEMFPLSFCPARSAGHQLNGAVTVSRLRPVLTSKTYGFLAPTGCRSSRRRSA